MATLKGQNLRLMTLDDQEHWVCVGMATNLVATLTGNAEDASHKDVVGNFSLPTIVSKAWSAQVDSLDVTDMVTLLNAVKTFKKFRLLWDETSTVDNVQPLKANFSRQGDAYINDATFVFNDRENSTKNISFIGASPLTAGDAVDYASPTITGLTKGQFVRLFLGSDNTATPSRVVAFARQLSIHVSVQMESASTKDTEGNFDIQEPVGLSYDISSSALVRNGESITSSVQGQTLNDLETIYENALPVKYEIANVSGANNRTKGSVLVSGSVVLTSLTLNAPNRQVATYDCQMQGYGNYLLPT